MNPTPFCVLEKPFAVLDVNTAEKNKKFLADFDANFYYRAAHLIINDPSVADISDGLTDQSAQDRKDASTLARMLWHHGLETLIMLIGAYIQAPNAVHAYFLKCTNENCVSLAALLLGDKFPKYHRLQGSEFSLKSLLSGVHRYAGLAHHDVVIDRFQAALSSMLCDYVDERNRSEYNSIKHGLRASHGSFGLAFGLQNEPGVMAAADAMDMIASSQDATFFSKAKRLGNVTNQQARVNFGIEDIGVTWSLEKVLMDLQLLSILLNNAATSLRIVAGENASDVTFNSIAQSDQAEFWQRYSTVPSCDVPSIAFCIEQGEQQPKMMTDKDVFLSYS